MPHLRTSAPTEPLTLLEAKLHLRVTHEAEDTLISTLISAARDSAEQLLQRALCTSAWQLSLAAFPGGAIALPMPPLVSIQSVQYRDTAGALQTLSASDYLVDAASTPGQILPALDRSWPATQAGHPAAVVVAYTAGYGAPEAVPAPIKAWMLLAIGDLYANREASSDRPAQLQPFADRLLDPYRLWAV